MSWVLAIDFGATYTTAAAADRDGVELVEIDGTVRVPSIVLLDEDGSLIAGSRAERRAPSSPDRIQRAPKRFLRQGASLDIGGMSIPVEEAVGAILSLFHSEAVRRHGGRPPSEVRLTHPATWGPEWLSALEAAARHAGVVSPILLLPEPVAAAAHLAGDLSAGGCIVVYDVGGDTFDAAVLQRTGDGFDIVGPGVRVADMGGEPLDRRIDERLGGDPARHDPERWDFHLEAIMGPAMDRVATSLRMAGLPADALAGAYLIGGSSHIPQIARVLARRLGRTPEIPENPEAVVASGAACAAGTIALWGRLPEPVRPIVDDDVQFTVYRPRVLPPGEWRDLVVFAHKTERVTGPGGETIDPIEDVRRQADRLLGGRTERFRPTAQDSRAEIARGADLRVVPEVEGVEFNPPSATFVWLEHVHSHVFRLRADPSLDGTTARGAVSVYRGALLLAEVPLSLRVEHGVRDATSESVSAPRFGKVFASYSHDDVAVVLRIEELCDAVGMEFLRDGRLLRAGENWNERLEELIRDADVFQLFWSHNATRSVFVEAEWRYALGLGRPNFVKPVYWEEPPPLRPPELSPLHFARLATVSPVVTVPRPIEPARATVAHHDVESDSAVPARAGDHPSPMARRASRPRIGRPVLIGAAIIVAIIVAVAILVRLA